MMGMTPGLLYDLQEREFFNMLKGYREKEEARAKMVDLNIRESWEQARWSVWQLVNIHLARKDKIRRSNELLRFPWDEERRKEKITLTPEEQDRRKNRLAELGKKMFGGNNQ